MLDNKEYAAGYRNLDPAVSETEITNSFKKWDKN